MTQDSAVQFETASRIHMGLAVKDLGRSVAFYRRLFGQEPTKTRPNYARFEVAQPPVNLSLNAVGEAGGATGPNHPVSHFGIQVKTSAAVGEAAGRLAAAGIATEAEDHVTCCYAVQNKIWATDPDGNRWEVYVVLDDNGAHHDASAGACCPESAAIAEAVQRGDLAAARSALQRPGRPALRQQPGGSAACGCAPQPAAS